MPISPRSLRTLFILAFWFLAAGSAVNAWADAAKGEPLILAADGKTDYVITLATDASPSERFAATELAQYLKAISGADLSVVSPTDAGGRPVVAVGPGAAGQINPQLALQGLGAEGIVLESRDRNLILTGGPAAPRGTLYAVYSFLEDTLGVRWWTPQWTYIPRRATLSVAPLAVRFVPPLEYREPYFFDVSNQPAWAAANKVNGQHFRLQNDVQRGDAVGYVDGLPFVHSFYVLVPIEKFHSIHPEWFSERNGRRVGPGQPWQLCLSNKALLVHVINEARQYLRKSPPETMISVSQNDYELARCECAQCLAIEKDEGSPSGPLLRFVNAVADAIKDEFPRAAVDTIAYQYTRKPPRHTRPRPNVIVRLCGIECDFAYPATDAVHNSVFRNDLLGWTQISPRTYIWTYDPNFHQYLLPFPNVHVSGQNIKAFARSGVKGIFINGPYQGPGTELQELRTWVQAKLLWNPNLEIQPLIDEFADAFYGPAGPLIKRYIETFEKSARATGAKLRVLALPRPDAPYLTLDALLPLDQGFDVLPEAVRNDAVYGPRIRMARAWLDYAILNSLPQLRLAMGKAGLSRWPFSRSPETMVQDFRNACAARPGLRLSENGSLEAKDFAPVSYDVSPVVPPPSSVPNICKTLPSDRWVQITQEHFSVYKGGWVQMDSRAQTGLCLATKGGPHDWTFQCDLTQLGSDPGQKWDIYVSVRVTPKGKADGPAFTSGFYDQVSLASPTTCRATLAQTTADDYTLVKVAEGFRITPSTIWWMGAANNPDTVDQIRIDRLVLIKVR